MNNIPMSKSKSYKGLKRSTKKRPSGISDKVVRLLDIYTLMAQNRYPSVEFLMERFEVSERSIYRYLETIGMIDPIEYDKVRQGYCFTSGDRIKKLHLSSDQLLLLLTMGEAVSHLGSPMKEEFAKFRESLTSITKILPDRNKASIVVKIPDAINSGKPDTSFKSIANCIDERRSIDIVYKTLYSGETEERRVDPYGLVFYDGAWILIGHCHLRDCIRHFALDRIVELKERNFYFKPKDSFNLEEHLSKSWGVWDEEEVEVTVRFSKSVADLITRKQKWHPSEKRKILPSGEVELTFTVAGVDEIKRWIFTWIPNVKVVGPEWLKKNIKQEVLNFIHLDS